MWGRQGWIAETYERNQWGSAENIQATSNDNVGFFPSRSKRCVHKDTPNFNFFCTSTTKDIDIVRPFDPHGVSEFGAKDKVCPARLSDGKRKEILNKDEFRRWDITGDESRGGIRMG